MSMELTSTMVSIAMAGALTSVVGNVIHDFVKPKEKVKSIDDRVNELTKSLKESVNLINQIQSEIEGRQKLVDELKNDVKTYDEIAKLKKSEVDSIAQVIRGELKREGRKSFWQGVIVNFIFFILGASVSIVLTFITK
ncbi:hypothetical protein [Clostridium beijerinckii]|uniref:hypothetical protein n=1 Tax=Clostridium beijerinckii TaxID=1520 RepID=UPI00098C0DC5|nr:hypothetical protein [Clostridium beijerinckii]NRT76977.1 t-SNARE complex subunit (syntaxin) [Clostridium beijerinckii]OOM36127.1 hypothetical protein CBEIJ_51740 [Clostridium beijerinckii]